MKINQNLVEGGGGFILFMVYLSYKKIVIFFTLIIHDKMVNEDNFSEIYSAPQIKMVTHRPKEIESISPWLVWDDGAHNIIKGKLLKGS